MIESSLGRQQLRLVLAWAELHQDEVAENWRRARTGEVPRCGRRCVRCVRCLPWVDMARTQTISKPPVGVAPTASTPDAVLPVEGYPSLRRAAELVGVSASTLSRRDDILVVAAGRETRVPAAEVLRLAALYGRRRMSRVAAELVEYAAATDARVSIAREVDDALARHAQTPEVPAPQAFLDEARRLLPAPLVAQIEATLGTHEMGGRSTVGWSPAED